jgi:predicted RNA-binding Zn ribbon-like protein
MTGETDHSQPGGRAPAPGPLALVQAFVNTHYDLDADHGAEVWCNPAAYAAWLRARGLLANGATVGAADLARALRVRDALRKLARSDSDDDSEIAAVALSEAGADAAVGVRFTPDGPAFTADGSADSALGLVLAHVAHAMIDGSWARLKICPGRDCGWAFYDHSRNGSSRWCSMSICGGREKARAHYRRIRGDD